MEALLFAGTGCLTMNRCILTRRRKYFSTFSRSLGAIKETTCVFGVFVGVFTCFSQWHKSVFIEYYIMALNTAQPVIIKDQNSVFYKSKTVQNEFSKRSGNMQSMHDLKLKR